MIILKMSRAILIEYAAILSFGDFYCTIHFSIYLFYVK